MIICVGAALTALTSVFIANNGDADVSRLTADIISPKSNCNSHVGLVVNTKNIQNASSLMNSFEGIDGVCFAIEENR